ncbi:hypothetical protein QUA13_29660 [Microcoleus sp. S28C3]
MKVENRSEFTAFYHPNSFAMFLLEAKVDSDADLFSLATLDELVGLDPEVDFRFSQVFEPGVLAEISVSCKCSYANLQTDAGSNPEVIAEIMSFNCEELSSLQILHAASKLLAMGRFGAVINFLRELKSRKLSLRLMFEVAMLDFILLNRVAESVNYQKQFEVMKRCCEADRLPAGRMLDACSQAVVWYSKRSSISDDLHKFFLDLGDEIVKSTDTTDSAKSSWYRGRAMVYADDKDQVSTRHAMLKANEFAQMASDKSPYFKHLEKTYLESTLKEFLYLRRDPNSAIEIAEQLIDMDINWSPSYFEKAEIFMHLGDHRNAGLTFLKAASVGFPYVSMSLKKAVHEFEQIDDTKNLKVALGELARFDRLVVQSTVKDELCDLKDSLDLYFSESKLRGV